MTINLNLGNKRDDVLKSVIQRIADAKRCVVVTGAGVSVNAGIPDFRSPSGLFAQVRKKHKGLFTSGRDLFDASLVFRSDETVSAFNAFITELKAQCQQTQPTLFHRWLARMSQRGTLRRCYTQNIDGLEEKAGLFVLHPHADNPVPSPTDLQQQQQRYSLSPPPSTHVQTIASRQMAMQCKVVPLHGDMRFLVCGLCRGLFPFETAARLRPSGGMVAGMPCPKCSLRSAKRVEDGHRPLLIGRLRPDIVLYNEPHPHQDLLAKIIAMDTPFIRTPSSASRAPDVVLIAGTSLKVYGCKQLIRSLAKTVQQVNALHSQRSAGGSLAKRSIVVVVNKEPVCTAAWADIIDYQLIGDVDELCRRVERLWDRQQKITKWMPQVKRWQGQQQQAKKFQDPASAIKHTKNSQSPTKQMAGNSATIAASGKRRRGGCEDGNDGDNDARYDRILPLLSTPQGYRRSKRLKTRREQARCSALFSVPC